MDLVVLVVLMVLVDPEEPELLMEMERDCERERLLSCVVFVW